MLTKMNFEQELLKEIKGLTQSDIARIVKMIHFDTNIFSAFMRGNSQVIRKEDWKVGGRCRHTDCSYGYEAWNGCGDRQHRAFQTHQGIEGGKLVESIDTPGGKIEK